MSAAEVLDVLPLREHRARLGLSVRALSRLSGVSRRTIDRVEAGDSVTRKVLEKLEVALQSDELTIRAAALGIEPGTLEELWNVIPWELDPCSRYVVARHPDGLSYEQIGQLLDLDPRTVADIEQSALAKLREAGANLRGFLEPEASADPGCRADICLEQMSPTCLRATI
jgi:DNA-binding XRE family transcriptional regulator